MAIAFACEHRGKKYITPPEFAGRAIRCKQCGTLLRIPGAAATAAPPAPAPKPAPPRPAPPRPPVADLYDPGARMPIALSAADAIESDDDIPVARPA